jgi:thiamine biosynthesis lipoprotein
MKETRLLMGMPITVEVVGGADPASAIARTFRYFESVDERFSTYKETSEISRLNNGELTEEDLSVDMREVLLLAEVTKKETDGYFDMERDGYKDPSGIVKGWAIWRAAQQLLAVGYQNFYIDAGGDIQAYGLNESGEPWRIGIRHPFELDKIVKVVRLNGEGVATSGTYLRGQHIYNPLQPDEALKDIVSLTVIGPNVLAADRMATAAFAMGRAGVEFIERLPGYEAYSIDANGQATLTTGFADYVAA